MTKFASENRSVSSTEPMDQAFSALLKRLEVHHAGKADKNREAQKALYDKTLSAEELMRNGMSLAAICEPDHVAYAPSPAFPEALRLGVMTHPYLQGSLPFMHLCLNHEALVFYGFEPKVAHTLLQNACLRLLASLPAHMLKLHLVDPMGLGKAFASLSGLSPLFKGKKMLTESSEIERLMHEVKEKAVSLVQGKLRDLFDTLRDYNKAEGEDLAEPYQILCIAGYPAAFSRTAVGTLDALISTGGKSGVMVLLSTDDKVLASHSDKTSLQVLKNSERIFTVTPSGASAMPGLRTLDDFSIELETNPMSTFTEIIGAANEAISRHSERKLTMDEHVFSRPLWQESSQHLLSIPLGVIGKNQLCSLELGGEQTGHHVLVGGDTGSGKSVLLHNLIVNGAWRYAPEELEFYLLDYKEGTEFAVYKSLPHARVLSMESSREFGICTLEYLLQEMKDRGVLFKKANVSSLAAYRESTDKILPRILVIIDEFQYLLSGSRLLSTKAAEMLEDITRRGRSFGIHLVLSTQTLADVDIGGGALDNIAVRIALRMSEANSGRIFNRDNLAPSTLKNVGEAYYNAGQGKSEDNVRFQTASLDREKKIPDLIARLCEQGRTLDFRHVFDGRHYLPFKESKLFSCLASKPKSHPGYIDLFLAEPDYIAQELFAVRLRRKAASNILMIGEAEEDAVGLAALMSFQLYCAGYNLLILDLSPPDSPWHSRLGKLCEDPERVIPVNEPREAEAALENPLKLIGQRLQNAAASNPPIVLMLMNAQSGRIFEHGNGFNPPPAVKKLEEILKHGPEVGVHCVLHYASFASFGQSLEKSLLPEFENQIVLRGTDSHKLCAEQLSAPIKAEGMAYIATPRARYGADPVRLYDPEEIFGSLQR